MNKECCNNKKTVRSEDEKKIINNSSIKSLSMHILENHLYSCITDSIEKNDTEVIDELMSLFKRFNK